MAKYRYKCSGCGSVFDIESTIKEKESVGAGESACPECGSKKILPQFSPINFVKNVFSASDKSGRCCPGQDEKNKDGGCCGISK